MDRHWLKSYPEGVPHDIHPEQFTSLNQLLEESFKTHAAKPFSVCMDRWMSYRELDELSAALGAWLQHLGLEPGARVAIMLPNVPQFAVAMAAILRAGHTCVNVNPLYTARELEHQLKDSGATAIVILENFAATLAEVIKRTPLRHVIMASMGDLLGAAYGPWITFAVRHLARMVPAYTFGLDGGLTVTPFTRAIAEGKRHTLKPVDCTLDSIAFLQYTGGTTGLSKGAVLTHRNIVAAILQAEAWFTPALGRIGDVSRINNIAALPLYHIFALTLCPMIEGWGMSETCAIGTNNPVNSQDFSGTIGLPLPGIWIAIKDDAGNSQEPGQGGEICIKGPQVMTGYYRQPLETEKAFTADDFMSTGDIGIMDERGYTRIIDRKKDMIIVSGFNVFPNELENGISLCPGIVECAAIGMADERQGEAIKVFVVKNDPALTEDDISACCKQHLTGYKRPKYIEFRDALPKTNVGKILRRALRAKA
ncbi:Long-chain-fatty-acid--CoA ligase [Polaromonas sp. CG9_12]|nr:Long-chain-fatty-acid--CoA ligase [Polaromonas sp. CG9_12]